LRSAERCEHFDAIRPVDARTAGCEGCEALGETKWIGLRACLTCGHVGCCEDSRHAHALAHYLASYVDQRYFDPMPGPRPKRPSRLRALLRRLFRRR